MLNKKLALFLFAEQGDTNRVMHGLLYAWDLRDKGFDVVLVLEGLAVKLPIDFSKPNHPMHEWWEKVRGMAVACTGCASAMGVIQELRDLGIPLMGNEMTHISPSGYLSDGYQVIMM